MTPVSITRLTCKQCRCHQDIETVEIYIVHVVSRLTVRNQAAELGWSVEQRDGEMVDICDNCTAAKRAGVAPNLEGNQI